jgi:hypothetical protein
MATFSMGLGMAGSISNMAAPPQLVETVPYRSFPSPKMSTTNPGGSFVDTSDMGRFALECNFSITWGV